ncbi:hypothetical protein [Peribacillus sp. TH14]|uniref:hypothetical protein n=1 Tax=Peribacillus sp. TH14 TaxID=2798481 RepID=UPI0019142EF6|nr:hypothetical protein [Peribacillus sp. TH14]MBK5501389.1 hypothetical protein [Peribacillus sp. TH14]
MLENSRSVVKGRFKVNPAKRKCLIFSDNEGLSYIQPLFIGALESIETPYEVHLIKNYKEILSDTDTPLSFESVKELNIFDERNIKQLLKEQYMGTQLYIASSWKTAEYLFSLALDCGYSEEEIQVHGLGEKTEYVFCAKCYNLTLKDNEENVVCSNCNTVLVVTHEYSKLRKGYLGFAKTN